MDARRRVVTRIPLPELWNEFGDTLAAEPRRELGAEDVRGLLRDGAPRFVVADLGLPLTWVDQTERFAFWKDELAPHLAEPERDRWYLEDFPGEYFYTATEWLLADGSSVVVAAKHHCPQP